MNSEIHNNQQNPQTVFSNLVQEGFNLGIRLTQEVHEGQRRRAEELANTPTSQLRSVISGRPLNLIVQRRVEAALRRYNLQTGQIPDIIQVHIRFTY